MAEHKAIVLARSTVAWERMQSLHGSACGCCMGTYVSVAWEHMQSLHGSARSCCMGTYASVAWEHMQSLHGSTCSHCMGARAAIRTPSQLEVAHEPARQDLRRIRGGVPPVLGCASVLLACFSSACHTYKLHPARFGHGSDFVCACAAIPCRARLCAMPCHAQCHAMRNAMPCAMHFGRRWEVWWSSVCCSMAAVSAETTVRLAWLAALPAAVILLAGCVARCCGIAGWRCCSLLWHRWLAALPAAVGSLAGCVASCCDIAGWLCCSLL
eukprot:366052-Chlamydomonas_euryale.AAC.30